MTVSRRIISNAGPLMALAKLNRLDLLARLFTRVEVPEAVYHEVVTQGLARRAPDARIVQLFWEQHDWPIIEVPRTLASALQPKAVLDAGEIEVLALARQDPSAMVLIDDDLARQEARRLGIKAKGTLGVLARAFRQQILTLEETELLIQQIVARPDIWISARLCEAILDSLEKD